MKCSICGAYNKPEYKKCIRCGNPLSQDGEDKAQAKILLEHQSPLKNTPTFREAVIVEEKKEEKEIVKDIHPGTHKASEVGEKDLWQGTVKKRSHHLKPKKSAPIISLKDETVKEDDDDDGQEQRPIVKRRAASGTNLDKLSKVREGQEVEIILPPEVKQKRKKEKKKKKVKLKWGRLLLVSVIAASLIIGTVIGFVYLFRGAVSGLSGIFTGHEELPNGGQPLVERIMINGETWHQITFYGEDGERILIDDPIRSLSIQDNKAVLLLDDSSFIPETDTATAEEEADAEEEEQIYVEEGAATYNTEEGYVTVQLNASLFTEDGDEVLLYVEPYELVVPLTPLKIVYPTDPDLVVEYTQVFVKIKTEPGSRVIIDGVNLTDQVDSSGFVEKYVNLSEGLNDIVVQTETSKHRTNTEHIYVTRPELDVPIELTSPDSSSSEDEIWIYGTVEAGAGVYVDTSRLSAEVKVDSSKTIEKVEDDGTITYWHSFEFRYVLSDYGWNEIEIVATAPDGRTSTLIHKVERTPDAGDYTRLAWNVLDNYDWLVGSTNALVGKIFACEGEVVRREDTDTAEMYLFNVGIGGEAKYVMIQYSGTQEIKEGETYAIYADVIGTYENYPLLAGRFIYDWAPDDETADTGDGEDTAAEEG